MCMEISIWCKHLNINSILHICLHVLSKTEEYTMQIIFFYFVVECVQFQIEIEIEMEMFVVSPGIWPIFD